MDRRSFMKFLGFAPATVAMGVAPAAMPAAVPVADATALAEIQRLKDLAEFHQAAREAEAKTLRLVLGLKENAEVPTDTRRDAEPGDPRGLLRLVRTSLESNR